MAIPVDHKPPKVRVGYLGIDVTKPPDWHGLVTLDLLFNNLTTGLFLVAASGELAWPGLVGPVARLAYPIALVFLTVDLVCLVLDLGSPTRFHHMLRVFKPTSPMSLGTWSLTAYSLPLTVIVGVDLLVWLGWLPGSPAVELSRKVILALGLVPAFGSAVYKGVLFSTSSQPGWRDARWLGAYLVNSALTYGVAGLDVLALASSRPSAPIRWALAVLLASNLLVLCLLALDLRATLARLHGPKGMALLATLAAGVGVLAPLALVLISDGLLAASVGLAGCLAGGLAWRHAIVMIPHQSQAQPANSPA
jgi:Ni/Fe-hydrogenase subunit HybB-like protein